MINKKRQILLVEDEEHLHQALKLNLELEGYEVSSALDGKLALEMLQNAAFDLVILDIMLPNVDGFTIIEKLRLNNNHTPILVLSAKNSSFNRVQGLKLGADDYLNKPFNLEELLLRVAKLIQKSNPVTGSQDPSLQFEFAGHSINFESLEVQLADGKKLQLTKTESLLLRLLIENKNTVVSREKILQTVWGYQVFPNTRTIDNFITAFRKYFEKDSKNPVYFISVRGVGYKFKI
jgi:two-component system, OmpR family, alkaline phosphatase synthesis response regulator PhoP